MNLAPRILISAPLDRNLDPRQQGIKDQIVKLIRRQGFEPQIIGEEGLPANMSWTFDNLPELLRRCQGAIVIGLARWRCLVSSDEHLDFITEYSHCEGILAIAQHLPVLLIREYGVSERGILDRGAGKYIAMMPPNADEQWTRTNDFEKVFDGWCGEVNSRQQVFFGYCGKATNTANAVMAFLTAHKVNVKEWQHGFKPGASILDQIQAAERNALGGIFLFTKDDELITGDTSTAAPRDNVIFEAGYFMSTKGPDRVLIILEEGAKMPADLGGRIYLLLKDRNDISSIEGRLMDFIQNL